MMRWEDRRWDGEVLVVSGLIVVLSILLEQRPDDRVTFRWPPGRGLPEICVSRSEFGLRCPACGLTRSLIQLARGDFARSRQAHRLGWLFGAVIVLQIPYRWIKLRHRLFRGLSAAQEWIVAGMLVGLLLANWLAELIAWLVATTGAGPLLEPLLHRALSP